MCVRQSTCDHHEGRDEQLARRRCPCRVPGPPVTVPAGIPGLPDRPGADELFELADAVLCADGPWRPWWDCRWRRSTGAGTVRCMTGCAAAGSASGGCGGRWPAPASAVARWPDHLGGRCQPVAAAGRRHQRGPAVLPRVRPGQGQRADDPGLAVLGGPRAGAGPHQSVSRCWTRFRLGPADDETEVTAAQVRDVVDWLITAGQWQPGDPDIVIVFDAGYDVTRLAAPSGAAGRAAALGPGAVLPGAAPRGRLRPPGPARRGVRPG